jgi:hypothetical protein
MEKSQLNAVEMALVVTTLGHVLDFSQGGRRHSENGVSFRLHI